MTHHACPICGGYVRANPASGSRRLQCVECGIQVILPAHSFIRDFAGAVERGLPKPLKSRLVA